MKPSGPLDASIMLIGEAPGEEEAKYGEPFIGASGRFLTSLLQSVGIQRHSCFITNICRHQPPTNYKKKPPVKNDISLWISDNVKPPAEGQWVRLGERWVHPYIKEGFELTMKEIAMVKPRLIIAFGNTPLYFLTGNDGISKWRGSRLQPAHLPCTVVPSFHPAAVLRQMELRPVIHMDLTRAKNIYEGKQVPRHYAFTIDPTFTQTIAFLQELLREANESVEDYLLPGDIETRAGMITCIGFARGETEAFCIPLLTTKGFHWSLEEEAQIVWLLRQLFLHPKILHIGQNYLYDCQYYSRHWLVKPKRVFDTMIGHHSLYGSMRKGLDFLSSMYCHDHVYWKEESKNWDPKVGEKQLWTYNCRDGVVTREVAAGIHASRKEIGMGGHFDFQQSLFFPVLRIMERGIRIDHAMRKTLRAELLEASIQRADIIATLAGHPLNPKSPKKVMEFFYNDMQMTGIKSLATGNDSSNSEALEIIAQREPLLRPLCVAINEARSIGTFLSTFIEAEPDIDGRMRSSFNIAGTVTYRFSSSENAFGSGLNFENLPTDKTGKKKVKGSIQRLPNIRALFIPDPGFTFFDLDLKRADIQAVAWEADDSDLKLALAQDLDIHCFNAMQIFSISGIPADELREDHPNYPDHRAKIGEHKRQQAKQGAHAVDYGVFPRKLATVLACSIHEAEKFIASWFAAHPGILEWHKRTQKQLEKMGYVENPWGARLYQFGRLDLNQALGWQPQSTVAGVINRILLAVDKSEQEEKSKIQLLNQVHDSIAGQFPTAEADHSSAILQECSKVSVPYPTGNLVIPCDFHSSPISWGHCK